jgi:hypothetical protein
MLYELVLDHNGEVAAGDVVLIDTTRMQIRPLLSNYASTITLFLVGVGPDWDEAQL